jgi:hypothetical protein
LTPNDVNVLTRNHFAMENSNHASGPELHSFTNGDGEQGIRIAGVSYHNTDFSGNVDTTSPLCYVSKRDFVADGEVMADHSNSFSISCTVGFAIQALGLAGVL